MYKIGVGDSEQRCWFIAISGFQIRKLCVHSCWFSPWTWIQEKFMLTDIGFVFIWEGPASQPQSTLSRWKNFPLLIKILTPPKLGPKKTVSIIAFRIALTLDVKMVWFGRQVAVCVQKRHKNAKVQLWLFTA